MNTHDFPVLETADFKGVIIDAIRTEDGEYEAVFNFFTEFGDTASSQAAHGFSWLTYLSGENLLELYTKIDIMVDLGLFTGVRISAEGTLFNNEGEAIADIDWNSYADNVEDITADIVASRKHTLH